VEERRLSRVEERRFSAAYKRPFKPGFSPSPPSGGAALQRRDLPPHY